MVSGHLWLNPCWNWIMCGWTQAGVWPWWLHPSFTWILRFALDLGLVAGSLLFCALGWAVHTGGKIAGIVFRVF